MKRECLQEKWWLCKYKKEECEHANCIYDDIDGCEKNKFLVHDDGWTSEAQCTIFEFRGDFHWSKKSTEQFKRCAVCEEEREKFFL